MDMYSYYYITDSVIYLFLTFQEKANNEKEPVEHFVSA